MSSRRFVVLALGLPILLTSGLARAWQEVHQSADEAVVQVDGSGVATVEHILKWRVVHGPPPSFDLRPVDSGIVLDPIVLGTLDDRKAVTAHASRVDDATVRIDLDEPRAAPRGTLVLHVRWQVDLRATNALVADGDRWRLTWRMPAAADGYDSAALTLGVTPGAVAPALARADESAGDDGSVFNVRRSDGRDVLRIVRPHVGRGESIVWVASLDARAFPLLASPKPTAAAETNSPFRPQPLLNFLSWMAILALGVAYGVAVWNACASPREATSATGPTSLPLRSLRSLACAAALVVGLHFQSHGQPSRGALFLALAVACAAVLRRREAVRIQGMGRWLPLRPGDAFGAVGPRCNGPLRRVITEPLLAIGVIVMAAWIALREPNILLPAADACVGIPIWLARRARLRPSTPASRGRKWLRTVFRHLEKRRHLSVVPWGRLATDGGLDEVRILVLPRAAMPGLIGIEVGLTWADSPSGPTGTPAVLVRAKEGSAVVARLTACAPSLLWIVGRAADERATSILPLLPTKRATTDLALKVAAALADRRVATFDADGSRLDRRVNVAPPFRAGTMKAVLG
jgi:hypothetical protein